MSVTEDGGLILEDILDGTDTAPLLLCSSPEYNAWRNDVVELVSLFDIHPQIQHLIAS